MEQDGNIKSLLLQQICGQKADDVYAGMQSEGRLAVYRQYAQMLVHTFKMNDRL